MIGDSLQIVNYLDQMKCNSNSKEKKRNLKPRQPELNYYDYNNTFCFVNRKIKNESFCWLWTIFIRVNIVILIKLICWLNLYSPIFLNFFFILICIILFIFWMNDFYLLFALLIFTFWLGLSNHIFSRYRSLNFSI